MVPMIQIGKLENSYLILLITLAAIFLIGYLDYLTGSEFSFSLFYLFPICFLALYKDTRLYSVIVAACVASFVWFIAEYETRQYSSFFFPVWNAFVRLNLFTAIGLLLVYLKEKDKKLHHVNDNLKTLVEEKTTSSVWPATTCATRSVASSPFPRYLLMITGISWMPDRWKCSDTSGR